MFLLDTISSQGPYDSNPRLKVFQFLFGALSHGDTIFKSQLTKRVVGCIGLSLHFSEFHLDFVRI
jgi:hypothetical protein